MIFTSNPRASYLAYEDEIDAAIKSVLTSDSYILGEQVHDFEAAFSKWNGSNFGVSVANGTDAIEIALRAIDIRPGDEVITVSHTAVATVTAIEKTGATPVLVDIDAHTYTIDPESFEKAISTKTRAVIPVHLYGHPAALNEIIAIASENNIRVIEDCAQAHGATYNDKHVGSLGDMGTFSFYPTKNLGAVGDGGFITTNDSELANKIKLIRQYGWDENKSSQLPGMNSRLDEIQAAILMIKLKYLDKDIGMRQSHAEFYNEVLRGLPIGLPIVRNNSSHAYHLYVIFSEYRDDLLNELKNEGIMASVHYNKAVHQQPAYKLYSQQLSLKVTEKIVNNILSLPMYPELTDEERIKVTSVIRCYYD